MTNARFASFHGLAVALSPSTLPVPLRKNPRARHELAIALCRKRGGLPSVARRRPDRGIEDVYLKSGDA